MLSLALGWESSNPEQTPHPGQEVQDMPYLGDLALYRNLATQNASTLIYNQPGPDLLYGTFDDIPTVPLDQAAIDASYDPDTPLVLVGTPWQPLVIDGPIVIPGDVIIRGVVRGRGTIYAGRNVHVVGSVQYDPDFRTTWPDVQRNDTTGQLRQLYETSGPRSNLGTVCNNGDYFAPGETPPGSCMQ
jgi:hypothetical protein